jgi:hypothetical protein
MSDAENMYDAERKIDLFKAGIVIRSSFSTAIFLLLLSMVLPNNRFPIVALALVAIFVAFSMLFKMLK